ncbi:hypothetical protein [Streptomyces sp. NRRL F-5630]|uniref:hypothetical protein n=1 Tax=Streptomyces sp. NRRL F-5630 TaxID=1463864 RepID=UPI003D72D985
MPANLDVDLSLNGHILQRTEWSWGLSAPAARRDRRGWGTCVELPAILELLDLIEAGEGTPQEVKALLEDAGELVIRECDDAHSDEEREADRCHGDCERCRSAEAEFRARIVRRVTNAARVKEPQYTHVRSGTTVHLVTCTHAQELHRYREPTGDEFYSQLHFFVHRGGLLGRDLIAVTEEELRDWCKSRIGPRGGKGFKPCKVCRPTLAV